MTIARVLADIGAERVAQNEKWGEQNHPDGTALTGDSERAENARSICQAAALNGYTTWRHVLAEEVSEAFAESDPAALRAELIQVAAVACAWAEAIDRRTPRITVTCALEDRTYDEPDRPHHFATVEDAIEEVTSMGWHELTDGRLLCHELDDDHAELGSRVGVVSQDGPHREGCDCLSCTYE